MIDFFDSKPEHSSDIKLTDEHGQFLPEVQVLSHIQRPYGITKIGAVIADPVTGGKTIAILDRSRSRIYSAPFPFPSGRYDFSETDTTGMQLRTQKANAGEFILGNGDGLKTTFVNIPLP